MKLFKRWRKDRAAASANDEPARVEPAAVRPVPSCALAASAQPKSRRRPATLGRTARELDYLAEAARRAQGQSSTQ